MVESILAHISGTRFFLSMGFVQEHNIYYKISLYTKFNKFSNKFKKPCFWPIFGAKNIFLENPALSRITSYWFLAPCQNLEKFNDTIQRKRLDRQKDGRKDERTDGQTLFYRTLPVITGGPKNKQRREGKKTKTRRKKKQNKENKEEKRISVENICGIRYRLRICSVYF